MGPKDSIQNFQNMDSNLIHPHVVFLYPNSELRQTQSYKEQGEYRPKPKHDDLREETIQEAQLQFHGNCIVRENLTKKHWQIRLETSPSLYFCDRCKWITQLNSRLTAKICPVLRSSSGPYLLENPKSAQHSWLMIHHALLNFESHLRSKNNRWLMLCLCKWFTTWAQHATCHLCCGTKYGSREHMPFFTRCERQSL